MYWCLQLDTLRFLVRVALMPHRPPEEEEEEEDSSGDEYHFCGDVSAEVQPYKDDEECSVCLAPLAQRPPQDQVGCGAVWLPACQHGFHVYCIERWLRHARTCPNCRTAVNGNLAVPMVLCNNNDD